jgi:8-oxo-dGTP pyrophosphatase MutT (NUDIX family)
MAIINTARDRKMKDSQPTKNEIIRSAMDERIKPQYPTKYLGQWIRTWRIMPRYRLVKFIGGTIISLNVPSNEALGDKYRPRSEQSLEKKMSDDVGSFLAGIGALIWDSSKRRYLILRRSETKDFAPGLWECVTGRLNQGEGFEEALFREVEEEINLEVNPLIILGTTHFYRGDCRPENELVGIVYLCSTKDGREVRLSQEHSEFRWVTASETEALLNYEKPTERWLQTVIGRAERLMTLRPEQTLIDASIGGFELDS